MGYSFGNMYLDRIANTVLEYSNWYSQFMKLTAKDFIILLLSATLIFLLANIDVWIVFGEVYD